MIDSNINKTYNDIVKFYFIFYRIFNDNNKKFYSNFN